MEIAEYLLEDAGAVGWQRSASRDFKMQPEIEEIGLWIKPLK